jgi:hypothetical protein
MIILVIDIKRIRTLKTKRDAPVPAHPDRPPTATRDFQLVQMQPRQIHIPRRRGRV